MRYHDIGALAYHGVRVGCAWGNGLQSRFGRLEIACCVSQVEQDRGQPGKGVFLRLFHGVETGIGNFGGFLLFGLPQKQVIAFARRQRRFGKQLPVFQQDLRLVGFRAVGIQAYCSFDHFSGFLRVPGALHQAGHHQVFGCRLLGMTESFVNHGQVRMGGDMFGIQVGDPFPVCDGFIGVLVLDIKFGSI